MAFDDLEALVRGDQSEATRRSALKRRAIALLAPAVPLAPMSPQTRTLPGIPGREAIPCRKQAFRRRRGGRAMS